MRTNVDLRLPGVSAAEVFEHLGMLDDYPSWMRLVHRVEAVDSTSDRPAWRVELRARVGPFARSKRLRMERTEFDPVGHHVRFERAEYDDRDHANWILTADVDDIADADGSGAAGAVVQVELEYTGSLFTGGVLQRVLDEEIKRGRESLARVVSAEPRR